MILELIEQFLKVDNHMQGVTIVESLVEVSKMEYRL